jgi:hypothetical protein
MQSLHRPRWKRRSAAVSIAILWTSVLLQLPAQLAIAQNTPLVSGGIGFFDGVNAGANSFQLVIAPVIVAPIGKHLLVESRFDFREFYGRKNGTSGSYEGTFFKSTQYLQLNYIASSKVTLTAGRFLTPFGTYNERLSAIWIQNFQDSPLIFPIGTRTTGSSDGAMARGVLVAKPSVQINYIAYFSTLSGIEQFKSARSAGDRIDVYFPGRRIEIGTSYARFLQVTHNNSIGAHLWWQPWRAPLHVRSEYAHGEHAQGYWLEGTYRLSEWHDPDSAIGRLEPLFRIQQTFRNSPGSGDGLPSADTKQADFGLVYHLPHEVRFSTNYSRKFSATANTNLWGISLTYRFLFPARRGQK